MLWYVVCAGCRVCLATVVCYVGWAGVRTEVIGGAVILWGLPLQLEEVLKEAAESVASVASVDVVDCGWK